MAARDRYTSTLTCPKCGATGVIHISEDDHPYMRNLHREVDEIEGGFTAVVKDGREIIKTCKKCGETFK